LPFLTFLLSSLSISTYYKGEMLPIHQKETLEPILQEVGARLEFLPPYSPDFSPIENCWSKVKILIRSMSPRTYADLEKAIVQAFSQITLRDIHHWFTHCCYCDTPFKEPT
jgi:transposase